MKTKYVLFLCLAIALSSCKNNQKEKSIETEERVEEEVKTEATKEEQDTQQLSILMEPRSESNTEGKVSFKEQDGVVKMYAKFTGLTPGEHAIHLHEKADCSAPDGTSTGGHWNPTYEQHGKWGDEEGYHKGDIGNFDADENGNGEVVFETDQWCISCDDETKNIIGKSVIVHQGVDDFVTQPTGDAGGRISCGGIIQ